MTDGELRLVHAPRGETSGWLTFPLRSLGEVGGRPMLGGLKLILSSFRLHNDAPDRRLPALLQSEPRRAGRGLDQARRAGARRAARAAARPPRRRPGADRGAGGEPARASLRGPADGPAAPRLPALRRGPRPDPVAHRRRRARRSTTRAMACARSMPVCSTIAALIPTPWTSAAAPGPGCWRCSGSSTAATAPAGSAAAAASCSIPKAFPFLQGQDGPEDPLAPADRLGRLHPAHSRPAAERSTASSSPTARSTSSRSAASTRP